MINAEMLFDALKYYNIEVVNVNGSLIKLKDNFEIEIEANGIYKLFDDGFVVAPFNDVDELCNFILRL